jgi:hypothetical protein
MRFAQYQVSRAVKRVDDWLHAIAAEALARRATRTAAMA